MAETEEVPQGNNSADQSTSEQIHEIETGEYQGPRQPESSKEARNMAMLCHLLGVVGFIAPLVIWLSEKDKHKFVDEHGRSAINYQISLLIYYAACWLLCIVYIGFVLLPLLIVLHLVFSIIGAVKASRGGLWRYPIAISFLKR